MTLKVVRRLQAYSCAIRRTFMQYFTRLQLTATAGLLVSLLPDYRRQIERKSRLIRVTKAFGRRQQLQLPVPSSLRTYSSAQAAAVKILASILMHGDDLLQ